MPVGRLITEKLSSAKYRALMLAIALTFTSVLLPACNKGAATSPATATPATGAATSKAPAPAAGDRPTTAKAALDELLKGNERYVNGELRNRDLSKAKLEELAKGQHPYAIILTCSDSRVSPELLFDQSMGDLFVIRVAGNVIDKAGMGSIEYAAEHLNTPLIYVLGHEKCGAVTAATTGEGAPGSVQYLVNEIKPAVAKAKSLGGELVAKSVDENVRHVVDTMPARSEILTKLMQENKIKIAGGTYSITNGKVSMVSELSASSEAPAEAPAGEAKKH